MAHSCRFANRGPCSGQRFANPLFFLFPESVHESNQGENKKEEQQQQQQQQGNKPEERTGENFWDTLIDALDDGILEFVRQISVAEQQGAGPKEETTTTTTRTCRNRTNPIDPVRTFVHTNAKEGKFTVVMPLGKKTKAEDVKVTVSKERAVVVEIKKETTSPDETSRLHQVFTKKVSLPEDAQVEGIKSNLSPEGVLRIEVPLPVPEPAPKPQPVEIPVSIEETTTNEKKPAAAENVDIDFPTEASD